MDEALIRKIMPNSPEAEQSVIGAMLWQKEAIVTASERLTAEDFYQTRYGYLFTAILALYNEDKPADLITLPEKLKEMGVPQELSSLEFLSNILRSVPTAANVGHYCDIVKEKAVMRNLIKVTENISNACYLGKTEINTLLDESEKQIFDISQKRNTGEFVSMKDIVLEALDNMEAAAKNSGNVTGVPTGFYQLDYMTAGLQKSDLILLAARPAMGKTALALNIAENAALKKKIPTAIFSLEMSKIQLANRLMSMNSKVEAQAIRTGKLKDNEWGAIMESARLFSDSPLFIDDTPGITISELRSKCRKLKLEHGLGLIIIDYLQLMSGSGHAESRQQEISEISRSLKAVAREINCPVLALSQLSRAVEGRPDKRPMLSDLRESGAIEQDADIVMFIYRDEYYHHDSPAKDKAEVIIGKQRNGAVGTVELGCQLQYTRFYNLEIEKKNKDDEE